MDDILSVTVVDDTKRSPVSDPAEAELVKSVRVDDLTNRRPVTEPLDIDATESVNVDETPNTKLNNEARFRTAVPSVKD